MKEKLQGCSEDSEVLKVYKEREKRLKMEKHPVDIVAKLNQTLQG